MTKLETKIAEALTNAGVAFTYRAVTIRDSVTSGRDTAAYTPTFVLSDGKTIIQNKGRFMTLDRQKHLQVKAQHPELDVRFVFSRGKDYISRLKILTYSGWCERNGFKYADKAVPAEWIEEFQRTKRA